ncbi:uncharacterized protein LOC126735150 isoform X2 [Anthonomus grandis grandis]|uniref:uncharacterized protein LOC126735150 isoform X2 n=1 Tax=Anthonomus grandis grandis TaxID=2921223 RepID=UPI00216653A7|nr:uncharacterized protein LOC126735150 isoform X2 [Anthonomus grandis grandis]
MSKSNTLNRSCSADKEQNAMNSPNKESCDPLLKEDGMDSVTEDGYNADISSTNTYSTASQNPTDEEGGGVEGGGSENRLKQQESNRQSPTTPPKAQEIMHKSSKEFYKAVAKQFGITCKMSDQCRCYDCQSHYFDCEYEQNEQEKTDGGLGAGTPVFLHEVMQGAACNIL